MSDRAHVERAPGCRSWEDADELENLLRENSGDMTARQELVVWYHRKEHESTKARDARYRHILWLIEHRPESELAGSPFVVMFKDVDPTAIPEAKRLWLEQAASHPDDSRILGNAANFFLNAAKEDWSTTCDLLRQAEALDPANADWPEQLAHLHEVRGRRLRGEERKTAAREALACYERAYQANRSPRKESHLIERLAINALIAEEIEKASDYATRLLEGVVHAKKPIDTWNYSNAVHWGNVVLGRVALRKGNREEAKHHLLEAGNTPGSPQLTAKGPDMALARELLAAGENGAAANYFKACSTFWEPGKDRLMSWIAAIEQGRAPDFDARQPLVARASESEV